MVSIKIIETLTNQNWYFTCLTQLIFNNAMRQKIDTLHYLYASHFTQHQACCLVCTCSCRDYAWSCIDVIITLQMDACLTLSSGLGNKTVHVTAYWKWKENRSFLSQWHLIFFLQYRPYDIVPFTLFTGLTSGSGANFEFFVADVKILTIVAIYMIQLLVLFL